MATRKTTITNGTRTLTLDATFSDKASGKINWSQDATEREIVSDGAVKGPKEFSVTGSLNRQSIDEDTINATRLEDLTALVEALAEDLELCTIENGLWIRAGYGMDGWDISRSGPNQTDAARVAISFIKINQVRARAARISPERTAPGLTDQATANSDGGTETATATDGGTTQAQTQASILQSGFDFVSGR